MVLLFHIPSVSDLHMGVFPLFRLFFTFFILPCTCSDRNGQISKTASKILIRVEQNIPMYFVFFYYSAFYMWKMVKIFFFLSELFSYCCSLISSGEILQIMFIQKYYIFKSLINLRGDDF